MRPRFLYPPSRLHRREKCRNNLRLMLISLIFIRKKPSQEEINYTVGTSELKIPSVATENRVKLEVAFFNGNPN